MGTYVYEFPWRPSQAGPLGKLVGGWGVSGMTILRSGGAFDVFEPDDRCLCGIFGVGTPDYIGGDISFHDPRSTDAVPGRPNSWFDGTGGGTPTAAPNPYFRRVGSGTSYELGAGRFGNFGRNVLRGPGFVNWQLAAFKAYENRRKSEPGVSGRVFQYVQPGAVHQSHRRHRQHEFRQNPRDRRPAHHSVHVAVHVLRAFSEPEAG